MYFLYSGKRFELDKENIFHPKHPNFLGGEPFTATETIKLSELNNEDSVYIINAKVIVDDKELKEKVAAYTKKIYNYSDKDVALILEKYPLEMSNKTIQQVDLKKSILKKTEFKRVIKIGNLYNSVITYVIDVVE
ncbi:hypothetical protein NAT51_14010 [Flavobacterium amniphilum]|uniref:hypothetical protein n=1 Tax=Flavobacterium amniphilum TaxID=1834035 RepID=UPI002029D3C1|nr:hypothetical protein [Flavobacterium amniphilum]MCL9806646.1 hypothetical protein [Flavobacterium amniphilum]